MARIRIVTKRPPQPEHKAGDPFVINCQTSLVDCFITAVADDGTEEPLHGVTGFMLDASSPLEPIRATLVFIGIDVDVEAETDDVPV